MSVDRWSRAQIVGKQVHWLLDIEYAGRSWRFSQGEWDVTDAATGTVLHYSDGIVGNLTYEQEVDLFEQSISVASVALDVQWGVDVAALVADGHDLAAATGELSKWIEGTDYADRRVILVGRVSDPEYGGPGISVTFSLEEGVFDDTGSIPEDSAEVNELTIPSTSDLSSRFYGLAYPVIIGRPGYLGGPATASGRVTGSQSVWRQNVTNWHQVVIAGHHVQADYVLVNHDDYTGGYIFKVTNSYDNLGQEIAVIAGGTTAATSGTVTDARTGASVTWYDSLDHATPAANGFGGTGAKDYSLFVAWYDPVTQTNGGAERGGKLVRDAGDVLEYVLGFSSLRLDRNKINALKPLIANFKIDCTIDQWCSPWAWLESELLPLLPVSVACGGGGAHFIYWNYAATEADAVATIDGDRDPSIEFAERIKYDASQVKNHFTMRYAKSIRTDSFTKVARLGREIRNENYARATIHNGTSAFDILATSNGGAGAGIVFTLSNAATHPPTITESGKTVTVNMDDAITTMGDIITAINNNSTLVRARLLNGTGGAVWAAAELPVARTLILAGLAYEGLASLHCDVSQRRMQGRTNPTGVYEDEIKSVVVYDEATANSVLAWRALAYALPHRTLECLVPAHEWDWLERGNVVLVTSAALSLSSQVAIVQAVEHGGDGMLGLRLRFIEDPARDGG